MAPNGGEKYPLTSDESLNDSNIIYSNTSSRAFDETDNQNEVSHSRTPSGTAGPIKRKYANRKSPNSRYFVFLNLQIIYVDLHIISMRKIEELI